MNELGVPYDKVEALTIDPLTEQYKKDPGLLRANSKGLVPTIVQVDDNGNESIFCDSIPLLKVLYSKTINEGDMALMYEQARAWDRRLCSPFYQVLLLQDPSESKKAWEDMTGAISDFSKHLTYRSNEINFYDQNDDASAQAPGLCDLCVFPFIHRLYIIEHFKGYHLPDESMEQQEVKRKILDWQNKMESHASVYSTLASRERLIPIYERYADGTAKSKVADSVREGKHAHDV